VRSKVGGQQYNLCEAIQISSEEARKGTVKRGVNDGAVLVDYNSDEDPFDFYAMP
jgi:hypothetical protein